MANTQRIADILAKADRRRDRHALRSGEIKVARHINARQFKNVPALSRVHLWSVKGKGKQTMDKTKEMHRSEGSPNMEEERLIILEVQEGRSSKGQALRVSHIHSQTCNIAAHHPRSSVATRARL